VTYEQPRRVVFSWSHHFGVRQESVGVSMVLGSPGEMFERRGVGITAYQSPNK